MTGPEHYKKAEDLLLDAAELPTGSELERYSLAAAQVHATLALVAATAQNIRRNGAVGVLFVDDWIAAIGGGE